MDLITLISDWKLRDPYIGMMKGELYKAFPEARLIDITHTVDLGNMEQTAFLLGSAFPSFPARTLHLILTGSTGDYLADPVLMRYQDHFFLGADHGVFALLTRDDTAEQAWVFPAGSNGNSLPLKMIQMAAWLRDGALDEKAERYDSFKQKRTRQPDYDSMSRTLTGHIVYIDSNYNVVTDIPGTLFKETVGEKKFSAALGSRKQLTTHKFYERYQTRDFDIYLTINRLEYIEATLCGGALALLASLQVGDTIEISIT